MAEREPTGQSALESERARLAKEREKLDHQESILNREEAFGKYDENVAPAEGEVTYDQFLTQRPAAPEGGVVRNGSVFQDVDNGHKFVNEATYEAQKGTAQEYYDRLGGIANNLSEYQIPDYKSMNREQLLEAHAKAEELGDIVEAQTIKQEYEQHRKELYESMGVVQLVKEAVRARADGDVEDGQLIREALRLHLTIDALKDDTETAVQAQKRFDEEIERFEQLVNKYYDRSQTPPTHAEAVHAESRGEGQPSRRVEDAKKPEPQPKPEAPAKEAPTKVLDEVKEPTEAAPAKEEAAAPKEPANESTPDKEAPQSGEVMYNGKKVIILEKFKTDKGEFAKILGGDHAAAYVPVGELVIAAPDTRPGKAVELRKKAGDLLLMSQSHAKEFWGSVKNNTRLRGGMTWMTTQFEAAKQKTNHWLNKDVDPVAKDEEKEKKRRENRHDYILGGALIAALAAGSIFAGASAANQSEHKTVEHTAEQGDWTNHHPDFGGEVTKPTGSAPLSPVENLPFNGGTTSVEVISGTTTGTNNAEAVSAQSGEGVEHLLERMNIDRSKWGIIQQLPQLAPQDFELRSNGDIWISHSGPLSAQGQTVINSLR